MIAAAALFGFAVAAAITAYEHGRDPVGWWGQRIGHSRWRRANLPAGGTLVLVAGVALSSPMLLAAAAGMAAAAISARFVDPLPPAELG